jgi:hypothetical protein
MATKDFQRREADFVQTEAVTVTWQANEVGTDLWLDATTTIATVDYTLVRYVIPLAVSNQELLPDGNYTQAYQTGGVSVYVFDGTETAYAAGTAPTLSEGTKLSEAPSSSKTLFDIDAYLLARGVARS